MMTENTDSGRTSLMRNIELSIIAKYTGQVSTLDGDKTVYNLYNGGENRARNTSYLPLTLLEN